MATDHPAAPELRPAVDFSFVPLAAGMYGTLGETIANGMADHLGIGRQSPQFLVAYAGQGGRLIEELSAADQSTDARTPKSRQHGGGYYKTSLDDAKRAKAQAKTLGQNFAISALVWMQGEANGGASGGINPTRWDREIPRPAGQQWYRDRLIEYRRQWSADLCSITGQSGEIPMFTYQTLGPAGEAQLMAANSASSIHMVGPIYPLTSALNSRRRESYGDVIHLTADSERWYGEQTGKVVRRVLDEREEWKALQPRRAWIEADLMSIVIEFIVPRPPLVMDVHFLPLQKVARGNGFSSLSGFQVSNQAGETQLIRSAEVERATRVRLRFNTRLAKDAVFQLRYGLPGMGELGGISEVGPGRAVNGQAMTELRIAGVQSDSLITASEEGTFYLTNGLAGDLFARAPMRFFRMEGTSAVLGIENREARNLTGFAAGRRLHAERPFSYGNLRDSDPEQSVYSFADSTYGARAGRRYPLWNWCVHFRDFPIDKAPRN